MRSGAISKCLLLAALASSIAGYPCNASAESIPQALAAAYADNPAINSARAHTRAVDENVPLAKSGLRPLVSAFQDGLGTSVDNAFSSFESVTYRAALGLQVQQPLFRGFRTLNAIREAKSDVLAERELLRNTGQNVLFDAAQTYLDVILAGEIVDLRARNVAFLTLQVSGIEKRFAVGDLTRTDVAQAETRLAIGRANLAAAQDALERERSDYRRIMGHPPGELRKVFPYPSMIPSTLDNALVIGLDNHPLIVAGAHQVDAQGFEVKQAQGLLLPTVSIVGTMTHDESFDTESRFRSWSNEVTAEGRIDIPLFQGGAASARIRQAKELLGEQRIELDLVRDQVRDAVMSAWADTIGTKRGIDAARQGVRAAEQALAGIQKEVRVGQRTTLDVLDAQQDLLTVREDLVGAERDRIVAFFSLLSAMGKLTAEDLNLPTVAYDPVQHYKAVENRVFNSSTPDGQ